MNEDLIAKTREDLRLAATEISLPHSMNEDLIARARESLELISFACNAAAGQPAAGQLREVTYTSLEAKQISRALIERVDALHTATNFSCIRKSINQILNLAVDQNLNQVFNLKFFVSQHNGQILAAAHVDTGVSSAFNYCVGAPQSEQFVPETAGLVVDKGDVNLARMTKADTKEICVSGHSTPSNPMIETHVEVIKIAKIDVPMPPNTLRCGGFRKNADGSWTAINPQPFDVGNVKQFLLNDVTFGHRALNIGGIDLAALLDQKCEGQP